MRWPIFIITAFVFLVLELGLRPLFVSDPNSIVSPSFMLILLVYVGFFTPPMTLAWAAIALGLMLDLTQPRLLATDGAVPMTEIVGPNALAFLLGAYITLKLRAMIFRDSPITLAVMVFIVGIFTGLAVVILLRMRGFTGGFAEPIEAWSTADELQSRFLQILYTAVLAVPVGWLLSRMHGAFGFHIGKPSRR